MLKKIMIPALLGSVVVGLLPENAAFADQVTTVTDSTYSTQSTTPDITQVITPSIIALKRISDVPDFDWGRGCTISSAAMIIKYWESHGYPLLIDRGVSDDELQDILADKYFHPDKDGGVPFVRAVNAFARYLDDVGYIYSFGGYGFATNSAQEKAWNLITEEINAGRPLWLTMKRYQDDRRSIEGGHALVIVGYKQNASGQERKLILHTTWKEGNVNYEWRPSDFDAVYRLKMGSK
ncbi:C39 family peptidase [Paenibacillus polymyxa]|uniref:Peptidase C39-like domain-containing protein n=1 Tax=Paenibacillus polymyxa TaxID=1406 RepID=A0A378XYP0_PAEPO|nr:C39 family peptidase [Paenibacillus polymyxa]MBE7901046.1 C39 family peptidase [Paenibacillus polymyxa]MBG9765047.1 hypothetical protein [Paenibacillus polymyxa]MCC3261599.1 C39 family peptidase [Paenibacillus polymyxa]MEE4561531.1 C39 family peptidase [Paenibacillus polymyxa]OAZ49074.1 hypothetical protein A9Z39_13260 [Paenibacillus polymyxa]